MKGADFANHDTPRINLLRGVADSYSAAWRAIGLFGCVVQLA